MHRKLIVTGDGSHSIEVPELGVRYHSVHGAIQESRHIFIEAGLNARGGTKGRDVLHIFEMGFGTGLNALLTFIESEKLNQRVHYETIDIVPLTADEVQMLNYCRILERDDLQKIFERLHDCEWGKEIAVSSHFIFKKSKADLVSFQLRGSFDMIFFDAFDPNMQPQLWTEDIFRKVIGILRPGGILTTYSSKGTVRRALQSAGFKVEKIPGPPGKREIVRAIKI